MEMETPTADVPPPAAPVIIAPALQVVALVPTSALPMAIFIPSLVALMAAQLVGMSSAQFLSLTNKINFSCNSCSIL